MINSSSVALGEIIVVGGGNFTPTKLIQGLVDESFGAMPYTEHFRNEIVATTKEGAYHTDTLEATSTRLAEIIRESLYTVKEYGISFAQAVVDGAVLSYSDKRLRRIANDQMSVEFINVDEPFLNSPLYPGEAHDKSLTYSGVNLGMLERLQFEYVSQEKISEYIGSSHVDLVAILDDPAASLSSVCEDMTSLHALKETFANEGGIFNFTKVKTLQINYLLKMYTLLTKMYATEAPVPWLKGGTLDDYRAFVNLMWNGLRVYLVQLRLVLNEYKRLHLVIREDGATNLALHSYESFKDVQFVKGRAKVFYTNEMLDKITSAGVGFYEMVLGYFWARATGKSVDVTALVEDPTKGLTYAKAYYEMINQNLSKQGLEMFVQGGLKAIGQFIDTHPELEARAREQMTNARKNGREWLTETFKRDLIYCYHQSCQLDNDSGEAALADDETESPRMKIVMSSMLVPTFLRALGYDMAASVIEDTFVNASECDGVLDKRERLHVALINWIVSKSFVGE